jgi:hypothetical protein
LRRVRLNYCVLGNTDDDDLFAYAIYVALINHSSGYNRALPLRWFIMACYYFATARTAADIKTTICHKYCTNKYRFIPIKCLPSTRFIAPIDNNCIIMLLVRFVNHPLATCCIMLIILVIVVFNVWNGICNRQERSSWINRRKNCDPVNSHL